MSETILEVAALSHWFGGNKVLFDINLCIKSGEIVSIVGPSGCGKSTLLRAIVGTHPPCAGTIIKWRGNNPSSVNRPSRDTGIVYQQYSLMNFLTARKNVALGLLLDQTSIPRRFFMPWSWFPTRKRHLKAAAELLDRVGLGNAIDKYPSEMSGGMRQRVAIAQALILRPRLLLLDEPFGALDEAMREELQKMLLALNQENEEAKARGEEPPYTILIITHELNEALYVGSRVVGLSQYWNWRQSEFTLTKHPGATVVYDQPAPVFHPDDEKDFQVFVEQKAAIRRSVFDKNVCQNREEFIIN